MTSDPMLPGEDITLSPASYDAVVGPHLADDGAELWRLRQVATLAHQMTKDWTITLDPPAVYTVRDVDGQMRSVHYTETAARRAIRRAYAQLRAELEVALIGCKVGPCPV